MSAINITNVSDDDSIWIVEDADGGEFFLKRGQSIGVDWIEEGDTVDLTFLAPKRFFSFLLLNWLKETRGSSVIEDMKSHKYFKEIVKMGEPAIPFIFETMKRERHAFIFLALSEITGEDIDLPKEDWGKISRMVELWFEWGREKGYVK